MEELIKEKLSTDADYETLNSSLDVMYRARSEFIALLELTHNNTASRTIDVIKACLNLSRDTGEDDVIPTALPDGFECPLFIGNMTTMLHNFLQSYELLDSPGLVRLQNILEGNNAASHLQEDCSNALQNTSQLFDSFRTITDWVSGIWIILYQHTYYTDGDPEEYSDYNYFNDDLVLESLNSVFTLLEEFPQQNPTDVITLLRDSCSFLDVDLNALKDDATALMEMINAVYDAHARVKPLLRRWASHVIAHHNGTNQVLQVDHFINEFIEKKITKLELAKYFGSERFSQQREEFISNTTDMGAIMSQYRYEKTQSFL